MGSIDIPPFLREKQKQKVTGKGSEPVSMDIPEFLKKKDKPASEDLSTGTEDISNQPLGLATEITKTSPFDYKRQIPQEYSLPANLKREQKKIEDADRKIFFGDISAKELSDLQQNPYTKKIADQVIRQYVPEAIDNADNPKFVELAAKNIKEKNRINFVNAEKVGVSELDNNLSNRVSELNQNIPANKAGRMTDYINELRQGVVIDDFTNNDRISDAISKIKKIENLEQRYYLNPEEKNKSRQKNEALLKTLNDRLQYNISRTGITPTINQLNDQIEQAVLSKVMESEKGEPIMDAGKDQVRVSHFKLGLTAAEKTDPILFNNVVNAIASEKKISEQDFKTIADTGQQIDNKMRFRGGAYDPTLIDTENNFDYTTFGQKKAQAAMLIGEWAKDKGYRNVAELPERIIRQGAKEKGVDNQEIVNSLVLDEKLLLYDAIPKAGWLDDVASGAMQPLQGINSTLNSWTESPAQTYLRSKSFEPEIGGQKVPDEKGQYSDVLPSERGRFLTDMFRGLGQFIPQVLLTKGVGAGLKGTAALSGVPLTGGQAKNVADFGGTFVSTFLQSYGPSYEEHLQKTGDASEAALIGTIDGGLTGGFELFLPDVRLAGMAFNGLKKGLSSDLMGLIKACGDPADLMAKANPLIKKFFTKATGILTKENLEELGTQYADFQTELIFDPESTKERNLNKELWDVFKSTTAAMLIPSILGAGGSSFQKDFTINSLHSAAINFDSYKESLQNSLDKEYISQNDFNKSVQLLTTHRQSIDATPEINAVGNELSAREKLDYAFEDTKIKVYNDKASKSTSVEKRMWEGKIKEAEKIQEEILMPKETVTETTEVATPEESVTEETTVELTPEEAAAIDVIKGKDLSQTSLKDYAAIINDDSATTAQKQEALQGISDQLTDQETAEATGTILGQKVSEAIEGLGYAPKVNEDFRERLAETENTNNLETLAAKAGVKIDGPELKSTSVIMPDDNKPTGETITIEGKENVPEEKSKVSIILPQSNKSHEVVPLKDVSEPTEPISGQPPISEPPAGTKIYFERPATELSHRGLQDVANEFSLPDVQTRDRKSDVQLRQDATNTANEWAVKGVYGKNVEKLVQKAESGEILTDEQRIILEGHLANLSKELREITDKKSPEFDTKLSEIKRLKDAGETTRSEAGAALRIPTGGSRPKDIADFLVEEMDVSGTDKLTENQKETAIKEFEDIDAAKNKYDEKITALESENARLRAEQEVKNIKSKSTKNNKKDYVSERKQIVGDILLKLSKARGEQASFLGAAELASIAPDIIRLVKNVAEHSAVRLSEIIDKVYETLKENIPDLEKKHIHDIIAGDYNKKKTTKSQLATRMVDLKTEASLINKLDALERSEEPKAEKKKIERNKEITDLRKKIKDLEGKKTAESNRIKEEQKAADKAKSDAIKEEEKFIREFEKEKESEAKKIAKEKVDAAKKLASDLEKKTKPESVLASLKTRMTNEAKEIQEQLKTGNFEKAVVTKQSVPLDQEAIDLRNDLIKLRQQRELRLLLQQRQNEGRRESALRIVAEVANVPRTLMTIADFSALLRQNLFFSVGHPLMTAKALPGMFKSFTSQKVYDAWFADLKESPRYEAIKESKLAIADSLSHDLTQREEAFMSTLAEKIPIIGQSLKVKGKTVVPGLNIVKGSERSYTMLLNKMRVDMFDYFANSMEQRGLTMENSPKQYKAMAEYINNATGRSDFGETLNRVAPILNSVFFSPRLIASRINMLTYWAQPRFWNTLPKEVKVDYFRNWISLLAVGGTILAVAQIGGADVEDDPRSSDFGKIKSGDTRWDIWGGAQPYVRVLAQVVSGERKSTNTGRIYSLNGDDLFGKTRGGVVADFFRNKLAPVPGAAVDILSGRTSIGDKIVYQYGGAGKKEISIDEYIKQRILPMTITGTQEAMKNQGVKALFTVGVPNVFGVGTQTYQTNKK